MKLPYSYPKINNLVHLTPPANDFELAYLAAREKEGRLYPDEIVRQLPYLPSRHPQAREWKLRQHNIQQLLGLLRKQPRSFILDLGCGNGWLTHQLVTNKDVHVLGMDINTPELEQANRLFSSEQCIFAYGDIFQAPLPPMVFDMILLVSCVQYFPNLKDLLYHLIQFLQPGGEIHIIDSPIYHPSEKVLAQARTQAYYQEQGCSGMKNHYHHHSWEDLSGFYYHVHYTPNSLSNRVMRTIGKSRSPFPWVIIEEL